MENSRIYISASRRTDIPLWYADWFRNRLRAGFCRVSNPFNPNQVRQVDLSLDQVRCFFFWTRHPGPFFPVLQDLDQAGHRYFFHVTLTGLPPQLEPLPYSEVQRLDGFKALARRLGPGRVWWRYDPIVMGPRFDARFHRETFTRLARQLEGHTDRVTLSLLDWYRKTERRMRCVEVGRWSTGATGTGAPGSFSRLTGQEPEVLALAEELGNLAREHGMRPVSCCEPAFVAAGIPAGSCIDARAVEEVYGIPADESKDPGQRRHCRCAPSYDIGAANSCLSGCVYCYSTASQEVAQGNYDRHKADKASLLPLWNNGTS